MEKIENKTIRVFKDLEKDLKWIEKTIKNRKIRSAAKEEYNSDNGHKK